MHTGTIWRCCPQRSCASGGTSWRPGCRGQQRSWPAAVEQRRRCGKEGCRCARGELHGPYAYLSVAGRMVYVPAVLADAVRAHLETSARLQETLEQISAVNLELLSRRELG